MIMRTELLPEVRLADLLDESQQLGNIVGQSIVTAKSRK
jgi:hypothetical protein